MLGTTHKYSWTTRAPPLNFATPPFANLKPDNKRPITHSNDPRHSKTCSMEPNTRDFYDKVVITQIQSNLISTKDGTICCNGVAHKKRSGNSCCGKLPVATRKQLCCGGRIGDLRKSSGFGSFQALVNFSEFFFIQSKTPE